MSMSKNNILLFIFVGFLASLPLVINGSPYMDDYARTAIGYYGWEFDGRPLTNIFYKIISGNGHIVDIYPLSQVAAYILLAICGYIITRNLKTSLFEKVILSAPIIFNPLIVGGFAFRYDAITIAFSIILSVLPFMSFNITSYQRMAISTICLAASFCFYQASPAIYITLTILFSFYHLNSNDIFSSVKYLLCNAASFILGFSLYKTIIHLFGSIGSTASSKSELVNINAEGYKSAISTIITASKLLVSSYNDACVIFFIVLFFSGLFVFYSKSDRTAQVKAIVVSASVICFILLFISTLVMVSVVKNPPVLARSFPAFGFFVSSACAMIFIMNAKKISIAMGLLSSFFMIIVYSNSISAIRLTAENQNYFAKSIARDARASGHSFNDVVITGWLAPPAEAKKMMADFPVIKSMNWSYFNNQFAPFILTYNGLPISRASQEVINKVKGDKDSWVKVSKGDGYELFSVGPHLIVSINQ